MIADALSFTRDVAILGDDAEAFLKRGGPPHGKGTMLRGAMIALLALAMPPSLRAGSVYLIKPDDPNAVVLTKAAFPGLHADGTGDDTAVLQQAIDLASAGSLLLLVPEGAIACRRLSEFRLPRG